MLWKVSCHALQTFNNARCLYLLYSATTAPANISKYICPVWPYDATILSHKRRIDLFANVVEISPRTPRICFISYGLSYCDLIDCECNPGHREPHLSWTDSIILSGGGVFGEDSFFTINRFPFCKTHISDSQITDFRFVSFRFANYSEPRTS